MLDKMVVASDIPWVVPTDGDEIELAVNDAHVAGVTAAGSSHSSDHTDGQVRLGLRTENEALVKRLLQMGWTETDNGCEWWVEIPDGHRTSRDFEACKAYAKAFRVHMRDVLPDMGMFDVLTQSSRY